MERIRNIVFDLGGVLIDLDHHQAISRFEEIGVKDAKQLLDPYEQKGFFLEVEMERSVSIPSAGNYVSIPVNAFL